MVLDGVSRLAFLPERHMFVMVGEGVPGTTLIDGKVSRVLTRRESERNKRKETLFEPHVLDPDPFPSHPPGRPPVNPSRRVGSQTVLVGSLWLSHALSLPADFYRRAGCDVRREDLQYSVVS